MTERMFKMTWKYILVCLLMVNMVSMANTDFRYWRLTSGKTFQAELVLYDPETDSAYLNLSKDKQVTYSIEDFSSIDSAWLLEWAKSTLDLEEMIALFEEDISKSKTYDLERWQNRPWSERVRGVMGNIIGWHL